VKFGVKRLMMKRDHEAQRLLESFVEAADLLVTWCL
jgi:hypothetical protein